MHTTTPNTILLISAGAGCCATRSACTTSTFIIAPTMTHPSIPTDTRSFIAIRPTPTRPATKARVKRSTVARFGTGCNERHRRAVWYWSVSTCVRFRTGNYLQLIILIQLLGSDWATHLIPRPSVCSPSGVTIELLHPGATSAILKLYP